MPDNKIIKFQKPEKKSPLSPKKGFALYSEGACLDGQNKDKLALEKYLLAEKYGYKAADLYASIARIYYVFDDYEKTKIYAQKAIDTDAEYDYPYYLMGSAYYELEDYEKSLKYYLLAEKYGLDYSVIMFRYILDDYTKVEPGNIMKQLEYAKKAISLDREDAYSYYWKGWIYYNHDEYKQAIKYYEKAEKMGYYSFSFYFEISYLYTMVGDLKKALAYANKCIFIDKDDAQGYYRKGWAYYNVGEYKKAKPLFITAEEKGCGYADMYISLGYIYQTEENFEKSVEYCQKAIKLDKYDTDGYSQMGNTYAALKNDYRTALKYYKKAYKTGKVFSEYFYMNFGMLYYMLNRYSMALKILGEGHAKFPDNYDLRAGIIAALQMKKEYKRACELTDELVKLEPDNVWNNYNLALSNYNRKVKDRDYDKVISFVENIKDEDVIINGGCYAVLSFSYYGKKDYDNALKYYVKFFRTDCAEEFLIKNKKELKKYYKRLIKKFPSNSELEEIANRYAKYLKDD